MPRKSELQEAVERLDLQCDIVEDDESSRLPVAKLHALVRNARKVVDEYYKENREATKKD